MSFKALDFSNYDSEVPFDAAAVSAFRAEGFDAFILGCQWPSISRQQAAVAIAGGMRCIGVYVEPFTAQDAYEQTMDGILIAEELGVRRVWAACERGGVTGIEELRAIRGQVEYAGLGLGIYSGKYTWTGLFENTTDFSDCPLWFAAYWNDGHVTEDLEAEGMAFGGWTKPAIHQYASTPELAGRARDRNMVLQEEIDVTPEEVFGAIVSANAPILERMARLEAIIAANGVTGPTGELLTGDAALDYLKGLGYSEALGLDHLNTKLREVREKLGLPV